MKTFPMFLKMENRTVVIIGGGEQAAQKCRLMLKTDAKIVVIAGDLDPELAALVHSGRIKSGGAGALANAALVFVATGCKTTDLIWWRRAKQAGVLVNVVDAPELCDAFTPSIVDRDPVVVAIGTEGTAPVLGRQIKTQIEQILEPRLGEFASLAGRLRAAVAQNIPPKKRRAFWSWVFSKEPRQHFARGADRVAAKMVKDAISAFGDASEKPQGFASLIKLPPDAPDLLTLRAVQRLQAADVVFYDQESGVLEQARRDAERVNLAVTGTSSSILAQLLEAIKAGKIIVYLCNGSEGEIAALASQMNANEDMNTPVEIVPGIAEKWHDIAKPILEILPVIH